MTQPTPGRQTRIERDSMGEMAVPAAALYGASTQRAVLNFPISGQPMPPAFIHALALVKQAAAETNGELGLLDADLAGAIASAAAEVAAGDHDDAFPIDIYQTGSGTSTNMNANEVIAHLAAARLGRPVHPNDHVNAGQSSNDAIPTRDAAGRGDRDRPDAAARAGRAAPDPRREGASSSTRSSRPVGPTSRTRPRSGSARSSAGMPARSRRRSAGRRRPSTSCLSVPLGGTAVGTGINAPAGATARTCARLAGLTGLPVRETDSHFHAQATLDTVIAAHGAIRAIALSLWKIGSDIRLMGMGPRAGLAELSLPETQPGSSIMPGKVNPVIVESLTMVVARVVGNDATIGFSQTGSLLELNVMMPVAAAAILESIELLGAAAANFSARAVDGLQATDRGPLLVEQGLMLATALAPVIGYDAAAKLAKDALASGRTIRELALERGIPAADLDVLLDPDRMTRPG